MRTRPGFCGAFRGLRCSPGRLFLQNQDQRLLAWKAPLAWWACKGGFSAAIKVQKGLQSKPLPPYVERV
ncbi:hypothetical protein EYF80_036117 [Liparis tanakae]|uniref:Uncharacterized protein n=1 Tax=Liparis tanakae TaxID=230148 RepID=A0A4Z2GKA0_9TELE|nr:hypothetical protein EYF80_036117 [Liparis tanakae]